MLKEIALGALLASATVDELKTHCGSIYYWEVMGVTEHALKNICGSSKPCVRIVTEVPFKDPTYCIIYVDNDTYAYSVEGAYSQEDIDAGQKDSEVK